MPAVTTPPTATTPAGANPPTPPLTTTTATTGPNGLWQAVAPGLDQLRTATGAVMRIDPLRLDITLVPGTEEPGGTFPEGGMVPADRRAQLVAAFNAGFKRADARGGELVDGRATGALVPGAASLVIGPDGAIDVRAWDNRDSTGATPTPSAAAVLQNLTLLVDAGRPAPDLADNIIQRWGVSFRPALPVAVWRSGAGIDGAGRLLYAAGANIVPGQLARLLIDAGAIRGMQLDINHLYVFAAFFANGSGRLLAAGMGPVPGHVLVPGPRDFFAVYARARCPACRSH